MNMISITAITERVNSVIVVASKGIEWISRQVSALKAKSPSIINSGLDKISDAIKLLWNNIRPLLAIAAGFVASPFGGISLAALAAVITIKKSLDSSNIIHSYALAALGVGLFGVAYALASQGGLLPGSLI